MTHSGIALIDPNKIFEEIHLADGMRVADFGCGRTGHFIFLASRAVGERGAVYAMDIIKDILENIKSRSRSEGYRNIQTIWTDLEKIGAAPIPEETLDAGFFVNVMFMLQNKEQALKEAIRLLKKDAWLVVVDWSKKIGPLGPELSQMVKDEEIVSLAETVGLKLVDKPIIGDYHFCLIFKKM
ncbi:MAG: hypothetical protein COU29_00705 [Candidatus Magasanikbacteria bacterium CG10_big_fil_rev_8_21_14_0_10_36_32]|uniref:Methyltransferase domain-containing protein n=1 Tax=Candidatus Magasanikbacteria bacterium CG10_big_fil_rev_8_21_14_0_10_36_32 TaxID=1974646 RepID=A0A2M6W678_9BACT|nr:MAG: hypothetical protein COU29_00705 [Candidatus Magasanikbacteria bacterium CG10_big_fil_rev_8_21_14_0_10_36_32]